MKRMFIVNTRIMVSESCTAFPFRKGTITAVNERHNLFEVSFEHVDNVNGPAKQWYTGDELEYADRHYEMASYLEDMAFDVADGREHRVALTVKDAHKLQEAARLLTSASANTAAAR